MNETELKKLLQEIDDLVTNAETTPDSAERLKFLQEALAKACRYIKGLNARIPSIISEVLKRGRFDPELVMLPLRDIAAADEELEVFRDKKILLEFLRTGKGLLKNQMQMSDDEIYEILRHIEQTYDLFIDESIAEEPLLKKFDDLQEFFCRPPWGGPGGPLVGPEPDDDSPSGVTVERTVKVIGFLGTLSSIGSFIIKIIEHFSITGEKSKTSESESIPYTHQVLALCLFSGFVSYLDAGQEIPKRVLVPSGVTA